MSARESPRWWTLVILTSATLTLGLTIVLLVRQTTVISTINDNREQLRENAEKIKTLEARP